jgi:hypothetical protein
VSSNNNSAATATGNAALAGSSSVNSLIGNALSAYGTQAGLSSFSGGSQVVAGGSNIIGG